MKLAEYACRRLSHELGGLTPSITFVQENLKTLQTPFASLSAVNDGVNLVKAVINPLAYTDEIQAGPYKGMTTAEKAFVKSPIPVVSWYRQIEKAGGNLDTSILFYVRPN